MKRTAFATFKKIVKKIGKDENESGAQMHQGEKKMLYTRKKYLIGDAAHIIKSIVECIEKRYSNVYNDGYMKR